MAEPSRTEGFLIGRRLRMAERSLHVNSEVTSIVKRGIHREIKFKSGQIRRVTKRRLRTIMDQELTREYGK